MAELEEDKDTTCDMLMVYSIIVMFSKFQPPSIKRKRTKVTHSYLHKYTHDSELSDRERFPLQQVKFVLI